MQLTLIIQSHLFQVFTFKQEKLKEGITKSRKIEKQRKHKQKEKQRSESTSIESRECVVQEKRLESME